MPQQKWTLREQRKPSDFWENFRMALPTAVKLGLSSLVLLSATAHAQPGLQRPPINIFPDCDYPDGPPARLPAESTATRTVGRTAVTGITTHPSGNTEGSPAPVTWACFPPYETPVYTSPADDSVAVAAQLEAAGYTGVANTGWVGVTAGNFCGSGKQLAVASSQRIDFSILGGPTPNVLSAITVGSGNAFGTLRAISSGRWDNGPYDAIVAVRNIVTDNVADVFLEKFTSDCHAVRLVAEGTVANSHNSNWVGAAVGNFDGSGKKRIAVLKAEHSNLFLLDVVPPKLSIFHRQDLDGNPSTPWKWKAVAAADLDGDGQDELIAVREVSDNHSPTVLVFKWNTGDGSFHIAATSGFGNNGNSEWAAVTVGDFNGDGQKAIVLVKNKHSNFAVFVWPKGGTELRSVTTADLDSVSGQNWTGAVATDWLGGDHGAEELIAVRSVHSPYRTNVFVYGNPYHRISRDTALAGTRAQFAQQQVDSAGNYVNPSAAQLLSWLRDTHSNSFNWLLKAPHDYTDLVKFLIATRDYGVRGKQLRVWLTLVPSYDVNATNGSPNDDCSQPEDTRPMTSWNAWDFFQDDIRPTQLATLLQACADTRAWASTIGRLAQDFPQLVALNIDDFSDDLNLGGTSGDYGPNEIAQIQARLRAQAPWMNFVPTVYYNVHSIPWKDIGSELDSMLFYFRNEKQGAGPCAPNSCPKGWTPNLWGCLAGTCAESSVANAVGEIADMATLAPPGRKLQGGIYFTGHSNLGTPSALYDFNLAALEIANSNMAGVTVYTLQTPMPGTTCTAANFLSSKYCTVKEVFGQH